MNATSQQVQFLVESSKARGLELLPEPERLNAYRQVEAWARMRSERIKVNIEERRRTLKERTLWIKKMYGR